MINEQPITERQQAALWALARVPYRVSSKWSKRQASEWLDDLHLPDRATKQQRESLEYFGHLPKWLTARWSRAEAATRLETLRDPAYR